MSRKYSYITDKSNSDRPIQVESAKRDGSGKNIENNYAKQNGNYQSLTAGLSNNFDTKKVMVDESAYNFRPTATMGSVELEVGSPCKVKKIIGGSVAFNQLSNLDSDIAETTDQNGMNWGRKDGYYHIYGTGSNTLYNRVDITRSVIVGHKYMFISNYKGTPQSGTTCQIYITGGTTAFTVTKLVFEAVSSSINIRFAYYQDVAIDSTFTSMLFDLTQMFGSTIADYIYSLEQANAGSGVAWFKRYFPKEYYAYNSGELVSVKTQGKKITHFNQWDEEWELGDISGSTGQNAPNSSMFRCKNYIKVVPNTTYYAHIGSLSRIDIFYYDEDENYIGWEYDKGNKTFTTPSNCGYIRFYSANQTTYNHDICINFHYDGERDGEYEPYDSETYPCDDIDLRGIPQLDENNNLAFDGDEYANDGNVKRKYGIVDLGTLTWISSEEYPNTYVANVTLMKINSWKNMLCDDYNLTLGRAGRDTIQEGYIAQVGRNDVPQIVVKDINGAPSGVYLIYELATPTDENSIPFTEVQECDNWGTEEWLAPTTDTRPCEVPVGHETYYLPDLKAKLEVAPTTPNENGVYVMEHNASGNTYTLIGSWLQANGYVNEISANAVKENIGGALRHQLAQANNIDFNNTAWVDLGELSWSYDDTNMYFNANVTGIKPAGSNTTKANILCAIYKTDTWNNTAPSVSGVNGNISVNGTNQKLGIRNTNYTSSSSFKNAMKGIILAYEKAS